MRSDAQVVTAEDATGLAQEAAQRFVGAARAAMDRGGQFCVALSGGHTPEALYRKLTGDEFRDQVDWERVQVFFSDERFVPPDSPDSNFRMANVSLLSKVPIPERQVHRVATVDISPEESATLYAQGIRRVFGLAESDVPQFDLILLGLGPDGHTASLFPGSDALQVMERIVAPNFVAKFDSWRITFTYPLINAAHEVQFLIQGEDKAERVKQVLSGDPSLPASRVQPSAGSLLFLMDQAAAARLPDSAGQGG